MSKMSIRRCALYTVLLGLGAHAQPSMTNPDVAPNVRWQAPVTVATGDAHVGPWEMNESEFYYVTDATAALRDDGSVAMVWVDNARQEVLFQKYDAQNEPQLDEPNNVSRSPDTFSWLPRTLFTADNQVYIAWQEIVFSGGSHGGEIFFARSNNGGRSFSEPINLSNTVAGAGKGRLTEENWDNGSLDIALGTDGEVFVAWTEYEGALHFRRSTDGGRSFDDAVQISGSDAQPTRAPSFALSPDGTLYLAWINGEADSSSIHITRSQDSGKSFGPVRVAYTSDGHSDAPDLAIDSEGNTHLVYAESPAGPFTPSHIAYVKLDETGQATAEPRILSPQSTDLQQAQAPAVGVDNEGRVYVIWEHYPGVDEFARGLGFSLSADAGENFTPPELVPGSMDDSGGINGSLQGQLGRKLSVNGEGDVAVVNSHFDLGNRSRVLLIRGQVDDNE